MLWFFFFRVRVYFRLYTINEYNNIMELYTPCNHVCKDNILIKIFAIEVELERNKV